MTEIPPPHETDGPQEPVDEDELEQETHPTVLRDGGKFVRAGQLIGFVGSTGTTGSHLHFEVRR